MAKKELMTGKLPNGVERQWSFALVSAKQGLTMLHKHSQFMMTLSLLYRKVLEGELSEGEFLASMFNEDFNKVEKIASKLLVDVSTPTPIEFYAALYYSLMANFESTINPMVQALSEMESDESDSTEPSTQSSNAATESAPTT